MKFKKAHTPKKAFKLKPKKKIKSKVIDLDENPYVEPLEPEAKRRRGRPRLSEGERSSSASSQFLYYDGEKYVAVSKNGGAEHVYPWEAVNACNKLAKPSIGKPKPYQIGLFLVDKATEISEVEEYWKNEEWEAIGNKPKLHALVWSGQKYGPAPHARMGGKVNRSNIPTSERKRVHSDGEVEFEIIKGKGKKKKVKVLKFAKKFLPAAKKKFPKLKFKRKK